MNDTQLLQQIHGQVVPESPFAPQPIEYWTCNCSPTRKVKHRVPRGEKCYVGVGYNDHALPVQEGDLRSDSCPLWHAPDDSVVCSTPKHRIAKDE